MGALVYGLGADEPTCTPLAGDTAVCVIIIMHTRNCREEGGRRGDPKGTRRGKVNFRL